MNVSPQWQDWVARARNMRVEDVMRKRGYTLRKKGKQLCGKCPLCGGEDLSDRFWVNLKLNKWGCRGCNLNNRDVIDLTRRLDRSEWANKTGDLRKALQLIGLCFLIKREIGHGYAESDYVAVANLAGQLDLTPEQLAAELESIARTYEQDRGASLLQ
jgi:hypothetical protein